MNDPLNSEFAPAHSKTADLSRESALALAQKSKKQGNDTEYKNYLTKFIALSTDPAKIRIARIDYFQYLIQNKQADQALQDFLALPANDANQADYEPLRGNLWTLAVNAGKFDQSKKIAILDSSPQWKQRQALSALFLDQPLSNETIAQLADNEREYFLNLYTLTKPEIVLRYLKSLKRNLTETEKDQAILSLRMKTNQWHLARSAEAESLLGKSYSFTEKPDLRQLKVEKMMTWVYFQSLKKLSAGKQAASLQDTIGRVQAIRAKVPQEIKDHASEVQLRVVTEARDLEKKTGDYILGSPVPAGLTAEQLVEYQKGLQSAASEFTQQSQQFDLIAKKISEELQKNSGWMEAHSLPLPDLQKWPWPAALNDQPQLHLIRSLQEAGNPVGALALLDYFREQYVKKESDFFIIRSGLLLNAQKSESYRVYLVEELKKNKQDELLKQWATSVNHPIPEAQ